METVRVLLNEGQVAQLLGCKIKTLQSWRIRQQGPAYVKIGRLVKYAESDVKAWLVSRTVTPTSD